MAEQADRRGYRGHASKQTNPAAKNLYVPPRKAGQKDGATSKITRHSKPPMKLNPPTRTHDASAQELTKGSPFSNSILTTGLKSREVQNHETFNPNLAAGPELSLLTYHELLTDEPSLSLALLPEYVVYYDAFLVWLRIVNLKNKHSQTLTDAERQLLILTKDMAFTVLEPVHLFLKGIGNITTTGGQHLFPAFPPLPEEPVANLSGYYGAIDLGTFNLYTELLCLGVASEAVCAAVSDAPDGAYISHLIPAQQLASPNLLGFFPLTIRDIEAIDFAATHGITADEFPATIIDTGININFVKAISQVLSETTTFKTNTLTFNQMSEVGAPAQQVITRPLPNDDARCIDTMTLPTSLHGESMGTYGMSVMFAFQLFKEPFNDDHSTWYPIIIDNANPPDPHWIAARNDRRNIPAQYHNPVFNAVAKLAGNYRAKILRSLVVAKR